MAEDISIKTIKGVGEKRAQLFSKLGVRTVGALLRYYPRSYLDLSAPKNLSDTEPDEICAIAAKVVSPVVEHRVRKNMILYKFKAVNNGIELRITIFNNKYAAQKITIGKEYIFYGKVTGNFIRKEMSAPDIIPIDKAYIRPIYSATDGLPSYAIEKCTFDALKHVAILEDPIPQHIRNKYKLVDIKTAIRNIHFPSDAHMLEQARRRLVFEELFVLQSGIISLSSKKGTPTPVRIAKEYSEEYESLLPYSLTSAQARAISECVRDIMSGYKMNRLIQGDVGSGKTTVAASLCYTMTKNSYQSVIMVPTEILAQQHYKSLYKQLAPAGITVDLLVGSMPAGKKNDVLARLESGQIDLLIGTHAIIEDRVKFNRLGLVITDEQHRFGVEQRSKLPLKGNEPHTLVMSATPIPRTLALMIYGNLDISILDELPPGRTPVETFYVTGEYHSRLYEFIKKNVDQGHQAYIVCALVEENDSPLLSAQGYADELKKKVFAGYNVGILHGKLKSKEKESVMKSFVSGETQILVSTTVIEVGFDVPNASIMIIENAERFGLSQLHQLRGRVGRGTVKSYCVLVSDAQNEQAVARLNVMKSTTDGFKIAEADLKQRGPGDFFGKKQHGLPELKIADLYADMKVLTVARDVALQVLDDDPYLSKPDNTALRNAIKLLFENSSAD